MQYRKEMCRLKNVYIRLIAIIIPVVLAVICLVNVVKNDNQASMPIPKELVFSGEYSYDGENWYPYNEDSDISSFEGDLIVRGHLDYEISEGAFLSFYCNHIGVSVYVNGKMVYMDTPAAIENYGMDLMPSMCGVRWEQILCPTITVEDEIEFHFNNHHSYGNKHAYKETLSSLYMTPPLNTVLEVYLKPYTKPFERIGYAIIVVGVMMLGAAVSAAILKSGMANHYFKMGMATSFVGGYILFDVMMLFIMDELLVIKTYGRQLCLMMAVYFIGILISDILTENNKKIANIIMILLGIVDVLIIALATAGKVLLYDTLFVWGVSECVVSTVLIVLCILEMIRKKKNKLKLITYICVNIAILLDIAGVGYHKYYSGLCFKIVFIIMLIVFMFLEVKQVVINHQASIKNKQLKEELEKSNIAIMLSQIQPHFLYNSLTSVMDLCDTNPKQAKSAIADFADYLRGNLSSLKSENLISFESELQHIEKYLRLEKLRFKDELKVIYDIQSKDFMLPSLSVQPLVENAVKHGVGQKNGGGTVTIRTSETENEYLICISDDGNGFDDDKGVDDTSVHVGIENIRKRLELMTGAQLEIKSKKGEGTTACISLPKRRD